MSRVVRQSKYRHVFGEAYTKENCIDDIRLSRNAWDSNYVDANMQFLAVCWEAAGGGSFVVMPWTLTGKLPPDYPLVSGHKAAVLDVKFHPFNDYLVASCSEDATVKLWNIPEGGLKETLREPAQTLSGHKRKVGNLEWNPNANNVLATTSTDYAVKVWDVEKGVAKNTIEGHANIIQGISWNFDGSLIGTTSKDKKLRIVDPRGNQIVSSVEAHTGVKGMRCQWLGRYEKIFSVGFSRTSDRQYAVWDPRNISAPLVTENIDTASGMLMPFYDYDTNILFLAGKGDGNIRYYEVTDDGSKVWYLDEYKSSTPARGACMLPKVSVSVSKCEIVRIVKMTTTMAESISFKVPRKGGEDIFQDDIYPPTPAPEPSVSADEWFGGKNVPRKLISLEGGFTAREKPAAELNFEVQKEDEGPQNEKELRDDWKKLKTRVSYLEAEIAKRDARIKELEGK